MVEMCPDGPNRRTNGVIDVHHTLSVPAEFLLPDTIYELEVLAIEESGNQAISVGFFRTEGVTDPSR
jgi:hypothetical protein